MAELFPELAVPRPVVGGAWVYVLQAGDGALYIGQTADVAERLGQHRRGLGAKFTADHAAPRLVYCEGPLTRDAAVARETQLKRWTRAKKEALIRGDLARLHQLSQSRALLQRARPTATSLQRELPPN